MTDVESAFLEWVFEEMTLDRLREVQRRIEEEIAWRERSQWAEHGMCIGRG